MLSQNNQSIVSSSVAGTQKVQKEFERRQDEHAKKSDMLKKKLSDRYEFKPQPFKAAREASKTPPRGAGPAAAAACGDISDQAS